MHGITLLILCMIVEELSLRHEYNLITSLTFVTFNMRDELWAGKISYSN